jgi:hypothetical protein
MHKERRSTGFLVWAQNQGASSITVGRIRQLETLGYFPEGSAREPGEETVLELVDDEAIVFEEIFTAGLQVPPHPAFTEILLKYRL